ncbi:MAG TPA: adenylate/guanylate cyclase domain-containing protein [Gaiellaceae bacterium]|nr:adenylate/guanylate cyclase domain-containing protein [Gaiellaceae bacterium]
MDVPDVQYARSGDVAIAYQVVGDGERDLVLLPFLANIFSLWRLYGFADFGRALARGRRLIVINPRGVGLSDRPRGFTIESRMDDIRAVMDAVGSERASLLGLAESAATCAVFAATYPERVDRLILFTPYVRGAADDEARARMLERTRLERERWGDRAYHEELGRVLNPQWADNQEYLDGVVWHHRLTASPATIVEFRRMQLDLDIADVLPAVRVPTLVLGKKQMREEAAEVAAGIPGAEHVEIPGQGFAIFENEFGLEAIDAFLQGTLPRRIPDTVLATLLFTDLVGSTERAAALGDREWRDVLTRHHADVRRELARYRGEEVDTAGDGFFCRFDGPARAMACARAVVEGAKELDLDLRAGIHTGECELVGDKVAGIAVVTGARISSLAAPGEVLVSSTVKDLVAGSGFAFVERGEHELKGVPGTWRLYAVADG